MNKSIIKGILYYIPFVKKMLQSTRTGGSNSARYCYSVWMRHLIYLHNNGMKHIPKTVAEIGPGDSLGIGLCALLSGAMQYYAFDIIKYSNLSDNQTILDELINMFVNKENIPDEKEFPHLKPPVSNYKFPEYLFGHDFRNNVLSDRRIEDIRKALNGMKSDITIKYIVPWLQVDNELNGKVDLILSQAVMEHIEDINNAYLSMYKFLKPNGYMSHEIDFKAHETHETWNGHLSYSDVIWSIIKKGRLYPINRKLFSDHKKSIEEIGFSILDIKSDIRKDGLPTDNLNKKFKYISDDDWKTASAMLICKKSKYI